MDVIVQENGLDVGVQPQLPKRLQLVRSGDLAVHHAVAVIPARAALQHFPVNRQHVVQDSVADGVDRGLHIMLVSVTDHFPELVPGVDGNAPGARIVRVGPGEVGGAGAQGTVPQHFQRADAKPAVAPSGVVSGPDEAFQLLQAGELGLFVHAHR